MKTDKLVRGKWVMLIFISSLLFGSCLSNKSLRLSDQELYQLGSKQFNGKKYIKSRETFTLLVDYYPDSSYAAEAQLLKADAYFKEKNYIEAGVEYNLFLEFHPAHTKADYALFQESECNYINIRSIDRDQTNVTETVKKLKKLLALYPESSYVPKAQQRIDECQKQIHEHSLYVARFYHRWRRYISSIERYNYLLTISPPISEETVQIVKAELDLVKKEYFDFLVDLSDQNFLKERHRGTIATYEKMLEYFPEKENDEMILFRLASAYETVENYDKAREFYKKVIDNFPEGVYAKEALECLKQIKTEEEELPSS